jgi:MFS family permease
MAILSSFPSEDREKYIGFVEAANGLGLLCGPLIGALLYHIGGFSLPFLGLAGFCFLLLPVVYVVLYTALNDIKKSQLSESSQNKNKTQDIDMISFLLKPRFVFGLFSQMFMLMTL